MQILFLDHTGQIGGAELFLLEIATREADQCLVVTFEDGPFVEALQNNKVPVKSLQAPQVENFRRTSGIGSVLKMAPTLVALLKEITVLGQRHDLIYANSKKAAPLGLLAGLLTGRPVIVHIHDILDKDHFSPFSRQLFLLMTNLLATKVVANSVATANAFIALGGAKEKVVIVNNGFEPSRFGKLSENEITSLREEIGLRSDLPTIGCVGRISRGKGQAILLEAVAQLPIDVQVLLVGDAPFGEDAYLEEVKLQAQAPGLVGRVFFTGFREDVTAVMQTCDVIVQPAIHPEAFGRTIVEAQLLRRPVIATKSGGVSEIVQHKKTGLICDPGNVTQLSQSIMLLLNNELDRNAMVLDAYNYAAQNFSMTATYEQFDKLLNRKTFPQPKFFYS